MQKSLFIGLNPLGTVDQSQYMELSSCLSQNVTLREIPQPWFYSLGGISDLPLEIIKKYMCLCCTPGVWVGAWVLSWASAERNG